MDLTTHQVSPSPVPAAPPPAPARRRRRALVQAGLLACVLGVAGASAARMVLSSDDEAEPGAKRDVALTVTTVRPRAKTLVTSHTQPGTIAPWAQADLYAKASGYVSRLRREWTAELAAAVVARPALGPAAGSPLGGAIQSAADVELGLWAAPPVDIGSVVAAGDLLIEVDVPERTQDVLEQETVLAHRQAELEQAHSMIETYRASLELAAAQKKQAQADVRRYQADLLLREKELGRIRELVRSDALNRAREE